MNKTITLEVPLSDANDFVTKKEERLEKIEEVLELCEENGLKDTEAYTNLEYEKNNVEEGIACLNEQINEQTTGLESLFS